MTSDRLGQLKPSQFALALLHLQNNPPRSLLWTFFVGALFVGVLGNLISDFAMNVLPISPVVGGVVVCVALLGLAGLGVTVYWSNASAQLAVSEHSSVPQLPWVITALSPFRAYPNGQTNLDNITRLIEYHHPHLQELFLVAILVSDERGQVRVTKQEADRDGGVLVAYKRLINWLDQQAFDVTPQITLLSVVDPASAEDSFKAVSKQLELLAQNDVQMKQIVIDVTAGTKAMSVGLTVAGFAYGCRLSYQATKRDAEGEPDFSSREMSMVFLDSRFLRARSSVKPEGEAH